MQTRLAIPALLTALAGLGVGCCRQQQQHAHPAGPVFETGPISWGEPVDGIQAGLALKREVTESLGPPDCRFIEFRLRNVSDGPVRLFEPYVSCSGQSPGRPMVDAAYTVSGGETYRIGMMSAPIGPEHPTVVLAPGESWSMRGQFDNDVHVAPYFWGLSAPVEGRCLLSYHNHLPFARPARGGEAAAVWTGDVQSAPIAIEFESNFEGLVVQGEEGGD